MKNNRAFTLVELLAVLVVLGILMLIAVPNVLSIMDRNKKDLYISDATKMKTMAEYAIRTNTNIPLPENNEIMVLPLSSIDNGDMENDPEGRPYSKTDSYIAIIKVDGFDEYWVNLVGVNENSNRGIRLTKVDNLKSDNRFDLIVDDMVIPKGQEIAKVMCGSTTCKTVRTYTK